MGAVYFSRCPITGTRCAAGHGGGRLQIEKMRAFIIRVLFYCIILGLAYAVLKYALPFLMPFLVAFLIAFILKPVINWVTQKTKLGRKPVSVLLLIAFYVLAAALITVLGTRLVIFCRDIFYALPQVYDTVVAPALNSLQGAFSARVNHLVEALTHLRIYVEAADGFCGKRRQQPVVLAVLNGHRHLHRRSERGNECGRFRAVVPR